jgi:hypothetical protein
VPNINIPVDEELLRAVNSAAALAGKSQKEWVVQELRTSVQVRVAIGGIDARPVEERIAEHAERVAGTRVGGEEVERRIGVIKEAEVKDSRGFVGGSARDSEQNLDSHECPVDGDPMVWNEVLKRWICECGYQGKVERG